MYTKQQKRNQLKTEMMLENIKIHRKNYFCVLLFTISQAIVKQKKNSVIRSVVVKSVGETENFQFLV